MTTQAEIRNLAAENLGKLGEGQILESNVSGDLDKAISEVYNILRRMNLVSWAATDDVPEEYAGAFAMLVADQRKTKYKVPDNHYVRITAEGFGPAFDGKAIKMIRRLQSKQKVVQTRIENF